MFVDEDCVESRSDVDDLNTRDCLYDKSRPVRYEGCCSLTELELLHHRIYVRALNFLTGLII